jgi:opacity protein-like surface antigen
MKKQLLCGVAASALTVAVSGTALAADMPVKAAPLPGCIWNGVYVGGHVGWGEPAFKGTWFGGSVTQDFKQHPSGLLGGAQVGQNWCSNTFVYGWEADVSFMNWKKSGEFSDGDTLTNRLSLLSSLRAKLGITTDPRTLLYVTGGLAYARAKATMFDSDTSGTLTASFNKFGGVVGIGAEWPQTNNWSWRLEGLYYILDGHKTLGPLPGGTDFATDKLKDVFVIRLGLNYKFGGDPWGKGPVVAKY